MSKNKVPQAKAVPEVKLDGVHMRRKVLTQEQYIGRLIGNDKVRQAYFNEDKGGFVKVLDKIGQLKGNEASFTFDSKAGKASLYNAFIQIGCQAFKEKHSKLKDSKQFKKIQKFAYACMYKMAQSGLQINYFHPGEKIILSESGELTLMLNPKDKITKKASDSIKRKTYRLELTDSKKELVKTINNAKKKEQMHASRIRRLSLEKQLIANPQAREVKKKLIANSKTLYGAMYYMGLAGNDFYKNMQGLYNTLINQGKLKGFEKKKFNKHSARIVRAMHKAIKDYYAKSKSKTSAKTKKPAKTAATDLAKRPKTKAALKKVKEKISAEFKALSIVSRYAKYFKAEGKDTAKLTSTPKEGLRELIGKKVTQIQYSPKGTNQYFTLKRHKSGHFIAPQGLIALAKKKKRGIKNRIKTVGKGKNQFTRVAVYAGDSLAPAPKAMEKKVTTPKKVAKPAAKPTLNNHPLSKQINDKYLKAAYFKREGKKLVAQANRKGKFIPSLKDIFDPNVSMIKFQPKGTKKVFTLIRIGNGQLKGHFMPLPTTLSLFPQSHLQTRGTFKRVLVQPGDSVMAMPVTKKPAKAPVRKSPKQAALAKSKPNKEKQKQTLPHPIQRALDSFNKISGFQASVKEGKISLTYKDKKIDVKGKKASDIIVAAINVVGDIEHKKLQAEIKKIVEGRAPKKLNAARAIKSPIITRLKAIANLQKPIPKGVKAAYKKIQQRLTALMDNPHLTNKRTK